MTLVLPVRVATHTPTFVPLLTDVLALLFVSGLHPGCDIVAQLGEGVVPRRGQAASIPRRFRAGGGLEAAALGATRCCVRWRVPLWWKTNKSFTSVSV